MELKDDANRHDREADVSEVIAQTSDAENALEALRLVTNVVLDLERGKHLYGHGGPQAAQLEALNYLVHQAQTHVRRSHEAAERIEAATADGDGQDEGG